MTVVNVLEGSVECSLRPRHELEELYPRNCESQCPYTVCQSISEQVRHNDSINVNKEGFCVYYVNDIGEIVDKVFVDG